MKIDAYTFPLSTKSSFVCDEKEITGEQWSIECIDLARDISGYSECDWLLYCDDFYQYSVCFFALLLANKNIVLAQGIQPERFKQAANIAEISIGSVSSEIEQQGGSLPCYVPAQNNCVNKHKTANTNINPNQLITLFTSGSTGDAKAIKKYWYQLANEIESLEGLFPGKDACIVSTVTHKHIYGLLFKLIWPVFTDKKIICQTVEYPEQLEYYGNRYKNTSLISSPSYLTRTCGQLSTQSKTNINKIFCSGGALSTDVSIDFVKLNQQVITEIYGSTETGGIAWRQQSQNIQWQLFPGHKVSLSENNTLVLQSDFLTKGETFTTDDKVELNGRYFNLLGRIDRIIKLHEKRLSLDELENELSDLPTVKTAHCLVLNEDVSKPVLVAVVELRKHIMLPVDIIQKKHLVNECKKALLTLFEPSLLPRKWRFVQQLPFNSEGKLVKSELIKLFQIE